VGLKSGRGIANIGRSASLSPARSRSVVSERSRIFNPDQRQSRLLGERVAATRMKSKTPDGPGSLLVAQEQAEHVIRLASRGSRFRDGTRTSSKSIGLQPSALSTQGALIPGTATGVLRPLVTEPIGASSWPMALKPVP
jgi:hypothetical protein